jgi:hypothetical protein
MFHFLILFSPSIAENVASHLSQKLDRVMIVDLAFRQFDDEVMGLHLPNLGR